MMQALGTIARRLGCVLIALLVAILPPLSSSAVAGSHVARSDCPEHRSSGGVVTEAASEAATAAVSATFDVAAEMCLAGSGPDCCSFCSELQSAVGDAPAHAGAPKGPPAMPEADTAKGMAPGPGLEPPIG